MGNAVKLIRSTRLTSAVEYAYAAEVDAPARSLWLAGACPLDEEGRTVAVGDYEGQAHQVMRNLIAVLEESGAALTDIARTTVYVASGDQADLVKAWNVYRAYMGEHDAPSTLLGVSVLGYHDQLVEVEAVAVLPS
ncbi:RidA family protein [Kitasatospora sp. NPDC036755]|uniref:RidA family protein n=1 Tax=Kitasatospora sp. NPDC036755 TaxID=3154600 RepID=UPI00340B62FA